LVIWPRRRHPSCHFVASGVNGTPKQPPRQLDISSSPSYLRSFDFVPTRRFYTSTMSSPGENRYAFATEGIPRLPASLTAFVFLL
jgi:hypothetical protein